MHQADCVSLADDIKSKSCSCSWFGGSEVARSVLHCTPKMLTAPGQPYLASNSSSGWSLADGIPIVPLPVCLDAHNPDLSDALAAIVCYEMCSLSRAATACAFVVSIQKQHNRLATVDGHMVACRH